MKPSFATHQQIAYTTRYNEIASTNSVANASYTFKNTEKLIDAFASIPVQYGGVTVEFTDDNSFIIKDNYTPQELALFASPTTEHRSETWQKKQPIKPHYSKFKSIGLTAVSMATAALATKYQILEIDDSSTTSYVITGTFAVFAGIFVSAPSIYLKNRTLTTRALKTAEKIKLRALDTSDGGVQLQGEYDIPLSILDDKTMPQVSRDKHSIIRQRLYSGELRIRFSAKRAIEAALKNDHDPAELWHGHLRSKYRTLSELESAISEATREQSRIKDFYKLTGTEEMLIKVEAELSANNLHELQQELARTIIGIDNDIIERRLQRKQADRESTSKKIFQELTSGEVDIAHPQEMQLQTLRQIMVTVLSKVRTEDTAMLTLLAQECIDYADKSRAVMSKPEHMQAIYLGLHKSFEDRLAFPDWSEVRIDLLPPQF